MNLKKEFVLDNSGAIRRKIIENYWLDKLSGELPKTVLPCVGSRESLSLNSDPLPDTDRHNIVLPIPGPLSAAIQGKCKDSSLAVYIFYLSALIALLNRYTKEEDILVGTSTFRKDEQVSEEGYFFIRNSVSRNQPFSDLFASTRQKVLEAYNYQECSFPALLKRFEERGNGNGFDLSEIFDFAFAYETVQNLDVSLNKFSLNITLRNDGDDFQFDVNFNSLLYSEDLITRFSIHLINVISNALVDTRSEISRINILSDQEIRVLTNDFNNTDKNFPNNVTVWDLFDDQVKRTPDAVAVVYKDVRLSYRQLHQKAVNLANFLRQEGLDSNEVVGIMMDQSVEIVTAIWAVLKAGGAYVFIDPANPSERISYMLENSGVHIVITNMVVPEKVSYHGKVLNVVDTAKSDDDVQAFSTDYRPKPTDLSYIIYTSGTTGVPKGIMIEHHSLCEFVLWAVTEYGHGERFRTLLSNSFSFDASVLQLFPALISGGTLYLMDPQLRLDIPAYMSFLREEKINCIDEIPRLINHFFDYIDASEKEEQFPDLISLSLGSEFVPIELVRKCRKFLNREGMINNGYGPSEACPITTTYIFDGKDSNEISLIGVPKSNMKVFILDEWNNLCPPGIAGEICISGKGLARGYINNKGLTDEKFISNPFIVNERMYKTGDLGRWHPDMNIEYLGRTDHQIKIRGYRVELGEIEAVLCTSPLVKDAVVIAREDAEGNQELIAYLVGKKEEKYRISEVDSSSLRDFLKKKLPEHMVPGKIVFIKSFPLTTSGKVDRKSLPEPEMLQNETEGSMIRPRDPLEFQMTQLWEETLQRSSLSVTDNFFEVGGHSLLAVRLMAKIEKTFGKRIPLTALFQGGTIENLTSIVRESTDQSHFSPLVKLHSHGEKTPFYCVHPAGGNVLCFFEMGKIMGRNRPIYGLQSKGIDGEAKPIDSVESMASYYIEELLKLQPEGPYCLGGYSFGVHVAFEMARQLVDQGMEVGTLVILDTPGMGQEEGTDDPLDDTRLLAHMVTQIESHFESHLRITYEDLVGLDEESQYSLIIEQMKVNRILPEDGSQKQLTGLVRVFKMNSQAMDIYRPKMYTGDITVFATKSLRDRFPSDDSLRWREVTTGEVRVVPIPGDHSSFLRSPHVEVFAEELEKWLEMIR